ncbi:hypothetical protein IHE61_21380 [Streptomyces sp. GKU 257-1]|nr:hypothetical protein [Streptomyces sp. GKU 257-1]
MSSAPPSAPSTILWPSPPVSVTGRSWTSVDALLDTAGRRPTVTIRVIPTGAAPHPLTGTAATRLLRVPAPEIGDHLVTARPEGGTALLANPTATARWREAWDGAATSGILIGQYAEHRAEGAQ